MFKKIHALYPNEVLFSGPLSNTGGLVAYRSDIENEMINFCKDTVSEFISKTIIFNCSFDPSTDKENII